MVIQTRGFPSPYRQPANGPVAAAVIAVSECLNRQETTGRVVAFR
jgi:hypothetical protein